jgi:uncharacterized protein
MIVESINQQIATALKARDSVRLSTLRMLSSSFNYERIAKQHDLSESEELDVVAREAKKRRESIEMYKNAQEFERADKEQKELAVLEEFLPLQLSDDELVLVVDQAIAETGASELKDMGRVIGDVKAKVGTKAEGSRISQLVKDKLAPTQHNG